MHLPQCVTRFPYLCFCYFICGTLESRQWGEGVQTPLVAGDLDTGLYFRTLRGVTLVPGTVHHLGALKWEVFHSLPPPDAKMWCLVLRGQKWTEENFEKLLRPKIFTENH